MELQLQIIALLQTLIVLLTAAGQDQNELGVIPKINPSPTENAIERKRGGGLSSNHNALENEASEITQEADVSAEENDEGIIFIAAGVPPSYSILDDAEIVFSELSANNFTAFLPTFQYEEVPVAKSTGEEVDFLAPCVTPRTVQQTMFAQGVDLVIPLELLYPNEQIPSLDADPLQAFIDCVGRDAITAVFTPDEPVLNTVSNTFLANLYARVKQIDPTLPVLMVHAPVTADSDGVMNQEQRQMYLDAVLVASAYADVVGFDVYGIPKVIAKITGPYANGSELDYDEAIEQYINWLQVNLPEKELLMVYQGFEFSDLYSDQFIADNFSPELVSLVVPPTEQQLENMVQISQDNELAYVVWWGQATIKDNQQLWESILRVSKEAG